MASDTPRFATDPHTAAYYEARAGEYDDWYTGDGLFADRDRPGWTEEVDAIVALVAALPAARTLDVACGTGFLTRHLSGFVVGVDQSDGMVRVAQSRLPNGLALVADALRLPFAPASFDRILTGHFYGHLPPVERGVFLEQAARVASELIVIDSAPRSDRPAEHYDERVLEDGSRHRVFKRYLTGPQLVGELGGEVLFDGRWFAVARTSLR